MSDNSQVQEEAKQLIILAQSTLWPLCPFEITALVAILEGFWNTPGESHDQFYSF